MLSCPTETYTVHLLRCRAMPSEFEHMTLYMLREKYRNPQRPYKQEIETSNIDAEYIAFQERRRQAMLSISTVLFYYNATAQAGCTHDSVSCYARCWSLWVVQAHRNNKHIHCAPPPPKTITWFDSQLHQAGWSTHKLCNACYCARNGSTTQIAGRTWRWLSIVAVAAEVEVVVAV